VKTIALAMLNWLHLIATVTWIGGITFVLFIAVPSAKELLGSDAGKIMGIISRRFTLYANYSILLLVITGVAIATLDGGFPGFSGFNSVLAGTFIFKHIVVLFMIAIHFYRGLVLAPKVSRAEPKQLAKLQKLSLNLVKLNFVLGLGVLLLSAAIAVI